MDAFGKAVLSVVLAAVVAIIVIEASRTIRSAANRAASASDLLVECPEPRREPAQQ